MNIRQTRNAIFTFAKPERQTIFSLQVNRTSTRVQWLAKLDDVTRLWIIKRHFSQCQNSKFTRIIKLKLTYLVCLCIFIPLRSLSLKIFSPVIKDKKVGNTGRHQRTKSLVQTALNLSKLGPASNLFQTNPFLQSLFDIPCSIRF